MTIGQMMLGEFDQEMQNTRKTLDDVPTRSGIGNLMRSPEPSDGLPATSPPCPDGLR